MVEEDKRRGVVGLEDREVVEYNNEEDELGTMALWEQVGQKERR